MKRLAPLLLAVLTACGPMPQRDPIGVPAPPMPIAGDDTCGAAPHEALIGQDATALERVLILRQVRVIRPGMAVTMDYRAERINFDIDRNNRIVRIFCG